MKSYEGLNLSHITWIDDLASVEIEVDLRRLIEQWICWYSSTWEIRELNFLDMLQIAKACSLSEELTTRENSDVKEEVFHSLVLV